MYDDIRNTIEEELERRERAWERTEDRLINQINDLKQENEELKLEILQLENELAHLSGE